jgi:hypothetical protein
MPDSLLDALDGPTRIPLIPFAVESFGREAQLDNEVAREVLRLGLAALLAPEAQEDLARKAALGVATIRRAELADDETSMTAANDLAVRRALEAAGVEFIDENGGGPGVRLWKPQTSKKRN